MSSAPSLLSFPPEILEYAFETLVYGVDANERTLTAMFLSHVCRSFRILALDSPQLWTCISRNSRRPGLQMLATSIERSGNLPLDIGIDAGLLDARTGSERNLFIDPLIRIVLQHLTRWRSFCFRSAWFTRENMTMHLMSSVSLQNLVLPALEDLTICTEPNPMDDQSRGQGILSHLGTPFFSLWHMPVLKSFTLKGEHDRMLPPTAAQYTSQIRELTVRPIWSEWLMGAAPWYITNMTSLSTLHLAFDGRFFQRNLETSYKCELTQDTTLDVEVPACYSSNLYVMSGLAASPFTRVTFPNIVSLTLTLHIRSTRGIYPLHGILVNQSSYRLLETLTIIIDSEAELSFSERYTEAGSPLILLPHCIAPSLKHLNIRSALALYFASKKGDPQLDSRFLEESLVPISLQTITLELPCVRGVVAWVTELVRVMRDQDCWHTFSEVVVMSGSDEQSGTCVVPRDGVQRWCDENELVWDTSQFDYCHY
ncbi:hypothetical protein SCHPADRAFT_886405 [Schizopora paradoxa]|uniref:F-box domain-containing protein n=1 Tax=Schizopora paradoxa TaxID=27342 RepID=A0A0H2SM26_9AGAM|nr:hypothetical protein SCHPADRAFT_886405 [Schizopora paradoxa]